MCRRDSSCFDLVVRSILLNRRISDDGLVHDYGLHLGKLLKEQLADVLDTLTPREEKVLSLRFGLEDGRSRTLEEVGKEFNLSLIHI